MKYLFVAGQGKPIQATNTQSNTTCKAGGLKKQPKGLYSKVHLRKIFSIPFLFTFFLFLIF
ncbi:hypothetical protein, partial [Parafilimonas sp.]|uniref:hypothetical protein n=1 Tax=Parafilimonas sp. TaxID=1969739 RepID=UPI0039E34FAF